MHATGVTGWVGNREIGICEGKKREKVAKVLVMLLGSRGRKRMLGGRSGLVDHGLGSRLIIEPVIGLGVALHILLLLQATHPLDIEGVESTIVGGLVWWQLLVAGLEAVAAVFTDADHDHLR